MTADLGPAATPHPTPEDRMRHARQPGPTFATYLDRHDRDQLDARAATAEQERDDALDDLREARADITRLKEHLVSEQERLRGHLVRTRAERDEALEARDVLRQQLDQDVTAMRRELNRMYAADMDKLRAERDRLRDANDTLALTLAEAIGTLTTDGGGCSRGWIPSSTIDRWRRALNEAEETRTAGLGSPADRAQDQPASPWEQPDDQCEGCGCPRKYHDDRVSHCTGDFLHCRCTGYVARKDPE